MTERSETLIEAIGGTDVLGRLSGTFYEAVLADPFLAPVFAHFTREHVEHVEHVAVWLAAGTLRPDLLVSSVIGLDEAPAALAALSDGSPAGITVISPHGDASA